MSNPLNGVTAEKNLAEVIAFRNLAGQLNEFWRGQMLPERADMAVSVAIWFQRFLATEPDDFWRRCHTHLQEGTQAETLRLWMAYPENWETPPAVRAAGIHCSHARFHAKWAFYPARTCPPGRVMFAHTLPDGTAVEEAVSHGGGMYVRGRVRGPGGQAAITLEAWHRAYRRRVPSRTAIHRCMRMCVLSRLCGRRLGSSKELLAAEGQAFLKWALVQNGSTALADTAKTVMRALLLDNEFVILVHQLPKRDM